MELSCCSQDIVNDWYSRKWIYVLDRLVCILCTEHSYQLLRIGHTWTLAHYCQLKLAPACQKMCCWDALACLKWEATYSLNLLDMFSKAASSAKLWDVCQKCFFHKHLWSAQVAFPQLHWLWQAQWFILVIAGFWLGCLVSPADNSASSPSIDIR